MNEASDSEPPGAGTGGAADGRRVNLERLRDMRRGLENLDAEVNPSTAEPPRLPVSDAPPDTPDVVDLPDFDWTSDSVSAEVEQLRAERDSFLEDLQRVGAEFANYRRHADRRIDEASERKLIGLVEKLLPALDALDSAILQGAIDVDPIRAVLLTALEKEGLEKMAPLGAAFDPNVHDAVMREDPDPADDGVIVVVEVMRAGYVWRGQVVRAAMVKVRG